MQPLNILVVTTHHGADIRETPLANELVASFAEQGHAVQVVAIQWSATPGGPSRRYTDDRGVEVLAIAPRAIGGTAGPVYRATKWLFTPVHSYLVLRRELSGRRYDCLIGFSPAVALSGGFLWGLSKSARSILYVTDFFPFHHRSLGLIPDGPVFHIARWLENSLFKGFGSIACMSRAGADYLRRNYALGPSQTVATIPLWSNVTIPSFPNRGALRAKYALPLEAPIVVFGGQIAEGRGIEEIIGAARLARLAFPQALFLMVGQGRLEHLVRDHIAEGAGNLVLMGPLPRDDYVSLVSACDVGIVCTVAGVDVPTFPSKTLDYLRAGVPVVASVEATTDYGAFVEERGFGVAEVAGDPVRLLGGIARVLESPDARRAMVAAGRKTLTDIFDVNRAAQALLDSASSGVTRADVVRALARLRRAQPSSRLGRVLVAGHRIAWSALVRLSGRQVEFRKKMFWGGYHDGVLPEATSSMIYRWGVTDWSVARSMVEFLSEGAVFIDVGAHFGIFALLGSWLVGRDGAVLAIEAMPNTFTHLRKNVARNRAFDNVSLHQGAAHSEGASLVFNDYGAVFSSLNSSFSARGSGNRRFEKVRTLAVDAMPIDEMPMAKHIERLDLVKIDVESSESSALAGMTTLIDRFRPKFIVEVSDGTAFERQKTAELMDWFFERGYQPFRWTGDVLERYERPEPIGYDNFVFVPTEGLQPPAGSPAAPMT